MRKICCSTGNPLSYQLGVWPPWAYDICANENVVLMDDYMKKYKFIQSYGSCSFATFISFGIEFHVEAARTKNILCLS